MPAAKSSTPRNAESQSVRVHLERLLSASDADRAECLTRFATSLRTLAEEHSSAEVRSLLERAVLPSLDYTSAHSLYRAYRRLRPRLAPASLSLRVAILGSPNVDQLAQFVELFLFAAGADVEIYTPEYGVLRQEILDSQSRLYSFRPHVTIIISSWRDLGHVPALIDDNQTVLTRVDSELSDWSSLWQTLHSRLGCSIVQTGFDPPPWRILGNHDARHIAGFSRYVALVNLAFLDRAPSFVTIHDTAQLSAGTGRWQWADDSFYHQAKLPCAPESLVEYAHSLSSITAASFGLAKKCLVLDLDNTLWGGVVGDDGLNGIRIGVGDPEGEAFHAFQRYIKGLQARGVILAVCSKNNAGIAREPFERHPGMVLRLADMAAFVANWEDKAKNVCAIAKQLNIGLSSMVFVDDNPAERAIVRQVVPSVAVPELPEDPAGYIRALERNRYFEVVSVATEDFRRTEYYRGNEERELAQHAAGSLEEFLGSLQMEATICPIGADNVDRCAQLIGRSNQFNLTTRRYSTDEVRHIASRPEWVTVAVSLKDRFGDNGLISVLLARIGPQTLEIDTWLMSCRVLKRGVEDLLLNHVVEIARARGLTAVRGEYIPTAKNTLVVDHYRTLGFQCLESGPDDRSLWVLPVTPEWVARPHQITCTL